MFRFIIRDVLWLTAVVALGVGWWAESSARRTAEERYRGARRSMEQAAELLNVSIVEKDGQVVDLRGANYVSCPECGATMYMDSTPTQYTTNDAEGNLRHCWRQTATCENCRGRFSYILMPDDVPGYMTWTRLKEEP